MKVPGKSDTINSELEKAWRVADFIELGEIMIRDAADRKESCGAHFREEYQTDDGEALRNDDEYSYVSSWEYAGEGVSPNAPALTRYAFPEPVPSDVINILFSSTWFVLAVVPIMFNAVL